MGYYRVTVEYLVLADSTREAIEEAGEIASLALARPNVLSAYHGGVPFRLTQTQSRTDTWPEVQGR